MSKRGRCRYPFPRQNGDIGYGVNLSLSPLFVYFLAPNIVSQVSQDSVTSHQAKQSLPSALKTRLGLVQPLLPPARATVPDMAANENLGVWHHRNHHRHQKRRRGGTRGNDETMPPLVNNLVNNQLIARGGFQLDKYGSRVEGSVGYSTEFHQTTLPPWPNQLLFMTKTLGQPRRILTSRSISHMCR